MGFRPLGESWPETCEASGSPCGATPCSCRHPMGLPQAANQSSRQPLSLGNGVQKPGHGSQEAEGQKRLQDHQVVPLPSKQGQPGPQGPTSSEPTPRARPVPGSVSWGWSSKLEIRTEVRPGAAAGPAPSSPHPGQWGLVALHPPRPGAQPAHLLSNKPEAPLGASGTGCFSAGKLARGPCPPSFHTPPLFALSFPQASPTSCGLRKGTGHSQLWCVALTSPQASLGPSLLSKEAGRGQGVSL